LRLGLAALGGRRLLRHRPRVYPPLPRPDPAWAPGVASSRADAGSLSAIAAGKGAGLALIWTLLSVFAAQFTLTALPLAAAALVSARLGVRRVPLLLGIALAVSGVAALLAFWAYFAWQRLGQAWTCLLPALSIAAIVWALSGEGVDRRLLRRLAVPLGLWALGSAFVVFLGFVHGGVDDPLATSASRFSGP